ncbi:hypothetical protein Anapl_10813 [Anas platyrhynchos]|uniref:Uncharacterized protein n=1 Tax=Anas platyrhynchos TaxID=8839 RepID=R0L5M2_ANAPL|nr:hypothetical protein Anapl_10813 [Anas platyrhynchos]
MGAAMTKASQGGESLLSPRCVDLLSPRLSLSVTILAEIRPHAGWDLGDKEMSPEVAPFPSQLLWLGDTSEQLPSPEGSWGEQGKDPETPGASLQGEFPGPDPQVAVYIQAACEQRLIARSSRQLNLLAFIDGSGSFRSC